MSDSFFDFSSFFGNGSPKTVDHVSVEAYCSHVWYEIEKYPFSYEEGLHNVKATYSILPDGSIGVKNEGIDKDGKLNVSYGTATAEDNTNSKLSVTFFWPFFGEYWIIKLGDNYEYSVVSDSRRKYLWILSKTKTMNKSLLSEIKAWLVNNGFDITKLVPTIQE